MIGCDMNHVPYNGAIKNALSAVLDDRWLCPLCNNQWETNSQLCSYIQVIYKCIHFEVIN